MNERALGRPVGANTERRRQELVVAAFDLIADHGFEGLRTRDVAALARVNIATLHYHFPTKEALIRGVLEHAMDRFRSTLTPHGSPSDQLRNYLRAVPELLKKEPQLRIVMGELALRSARDRSIAAIMGEMYATWHAAVRGLLRKAIKSGQLEQGIDNDAVAALIVATFTGMTLPTMGDTPKSDQVAKQLERFLGIRDGSPRNKSSN
jgi:AcrR family transcriptional regulator